MAEASRITELETRLAHQDKALADLNEVVLQQWQRIDVLERQLSRLNQEFQNMEQGPVPVDRPPHY